MQNRLQKENSFNSDQKSSVQDKKIIETYNKKIKPIRTSEFSKDNIIIENNDKELKIDDIRLQNFFDKYLKPEGNQQQPQDKRQSTMSLDISKPIKLDSNRRSRRSEIKIFEQQKEKKMKKRKKQKAEERQKEKKNLEQQIEDDIHNTVQQILNEKQKIFKNLEKILESEYPEEIFTPLELKSKLEKFQNQKDYYESFKNLMLEIIEQEEKLYKKHKLMKISGFRKIFKKLTEYMKTSLDTTKRLCKINQTLLLVKPNKKNIFEMQKGIVLDDIHETLLKIKYQQKQLTDDSKINPKFVQKRFIRQLDMIQEKKISTDISQMRKKIAEQNKSEIETNLSVFKKVCVRYERLYNEQDIIQQKLEESQQQNIYNQKFLRKKTYRQFKKIFEMSSKSVCQNLLDALDQLIFSFQCLILKHKFILIIQLIKHNIFIFLLQALQFLQPLTYIVKFFYFY